MRAQDGGGILGRLARIDVAAGLLLMAVAAALWMQAAKLDPGVVANIGPGMMPRVFAGVLFAASAALAALGWLRRGGPSETLGFSLRGPLVVGAAIAAFAAFLRGAELGALELPQLGLAVIGPVTVVLAGYAAAEADFRELVALGLGLTAGCMALFGDFLGMQMPIAPRFLEEAVAPAALLRAAYLAEVVIALAAWRLLPKRPA
jgi:putative tricarboxylic transport membrane protein